MEFAKYMALDVIEDALTDLGTPFGCGMAAGLCGAFLMCQLISEAEWELYLARIEARVNFSEIRAGISRLTH